MNLQFRHPSQQSLLQYTAFQKTLIEKKDWKTVDALRMAQQMVVQAHPAAKLFLDRIQQKVSSDLIIEKINYLFKIHEYIEEYNPWKTVTSKSLIERLYDLHEPIYCSEGEVHNDRLLIIFDTIYNAFGVSNLVLYSILKSKGYHFLLLKDPSLACYMRGIPEWGLSLRELGQKITLFAHENGYQSLRVMGYSSAGYASCYISSVIACQRYLGFSIASDLSANSTLPLSWLMSPELRQYLYNDEFVNLRERMVLSKHVERRLIVGNLWQDDILHVDNLRGLENIQIDTLEQTFHDTPLSAIRYQQFDAYLRWLME